MKKLIPVFFPLSALIISLFNLNTIYAQDLVPGNWPHLKGYWKFQNVNKLTKSTVGEDLILTGTHQAVAGPAVGDTAIRICIGSYYTCAHGMAPNGGGDSVNRYTLMFDFKVLSFKKWHTFFKTDSNNNNDGECFIRPLSGSNPGRLGVAATGYSADSINPNQWYRLMISVNMGNYYRYYLNGKLLHEGDTQDVDGRFALTPKMIFFGDDNQEDDTIDVASVAVFDTCLSAADIFKIGSIDPCVVNPPKVSLGRDTSLCDYNTIIKNAGAGFKKYQWSTGGTQASLTITKSIGLGTKKIWCKVTDVNGCIAADTFVLTYLTSPLVNLGADQEFCEGYKTKLIAGTDTSYQYLWKYLQFGNTLSVKNNITTDSGGNYSVTVTSKSGCVNRDTINIKVFKQPAKPTITVSGKTNLCIGESVVLNGPNGYFDYIWSNGASSQTIGSNKSDTLKLKVTDYNNCTSVYSDSVVIRVFPLPPKPKLIQTGNPRFCDGDSLNLTAPTGYAEYLWQDGPGLAKRTVKHTGMFYVKVKDINACKSVNSDTVIVKIDPKPVKPLIAVFGKKELCEGEYSIISAPPGFSKYWWANNKSSQNDTVTTSGNYSVSVENTFGCKSEPSDVVTITVHPVPSKPAVVKAGVDSLICNILSNQYKWYRNGSLLITDTLRHISSATSGYYQVQTGNGWCWSVLSDSFNYRNSGFAYIRKLSNEIKVYPNPSADVIVVKLDTPLEFENAPMELVDMQGKVVYNAEVSSGNLQKGMTLNLQTLCSGIYQLRVLLPGEILSVRVEKI